MKKETKNKVKKGAKKSNFKYIADFGATIDPQNPWQTIDPNNGQPILMNNTPDVSAQNAQMSKNFAGVTSVYPTNQQSIQLQQPNAPAQQAVQQPAQKPKKKQGNGINTGDLIAGALQGLDALLPYQKPNQNINPLVYTPQVNPYGIQGSQATFANGGKLSKAKAKEILHDGTAQGHRLTDKQRRYFGAIASGYANKKKKASGGIVVNEGAPDEQYDQQGNRVYNNHRNFSAQSPVAVNNNQVIVPGTKRVAFENERDINGNLIAYRPIFQGIDYRNAIDTMRNLPNTAGNGVPYDRSPQNFSDANDNFKPSTNSNQWLPSNRYNQQPVTPLPTPREDFRTPINYVASNMAYGGTVPLGNGNVQVENNNYEMVSPQTMKLTGKSHNEQRPDGSTGTDVSANGNQIEAEKGESLHTDDNGNVIVGGNLHFPNTKTKFKQIFENIGKQEAKNEKLKTKSSYFLNNFDSKDPYGAPAFNTGKVMSDAYEQQAKQVADVKQHVTDIQQQMLDIADKTGTDPKKISNLFSGKAKYGMTLPKADSGGDIKSIIAKAAQDQGVDPETLLKISNIESGYNTGAVSNKGAMGFAQFEPATAKQYGISKAQLTSTNPKDQAAVANAMAKHYKTLLVTNNNDPILAEAAYNGGQGAVNDAKKGLGKDNISGQDWIGYQQQQLQKHPTSDPSKWRTQTLNYVNSLNSGKPEDPSYNTFRSTYYGDGSNNGYTSPEYGITANRTNGTSSGIKGNFAPNESELQELNKQYAQNVSPVDPNRDNTGVVANPARDNAANVIDNKIGNFSQAPKPNFKPIREKFSPMNYIGEAAALFDKAEPVPSTQVSPILEQEYNLSNQNRKNDILSAYNPALKANYNNPAIQAGIAGQLAEHLSNVDAEELQMNQQNNGAIRARNLQEMRGVRDTNTRLTEDQQNKTAATKAIVEDNRYRAAESVGAKEQQRKAQNNMMKMYENYAGWQQDPDGNYHMLRPDAIFPGQNVYMNDVTQDNNTKKTVKTKQGNTETDTTTTSYFGGMIASRKGSTIKKRKEKKK